MVNIRFLLTRLYFLHSRYTILQELSLADISILRYSPRIVSQKRRKSILPPYARDTRSKIRHFNIQHRMKSSVIEEEEEKEEENKEGTSLEEISFVSLFLGERDGIRSCSPAWVGSNCFRPIGGGKFGRGIFQARRNSCSVKDDAGACNEAEAPWRCIFSRRTAPCTHAHTPSRFRKEMRVFLERFLPIAHPHLRLVDLPPSSPPFFHEFIFGW